MNIYLSETFVEKNNDSHKYAKYWASNLYSRINGIMKTVPFELQHTNTPFCFYFVKNFIATFFTKGITKKDVNHKYLYRGIGSQRFENNDGFSSFTYDKDVASKFAKDGNDDGLILSLEVKTLSTKVKMYEINESIDEIYHESELLLLPGEFKIISENKDDNNIKVTYKVNNNLVNKYMTSENPKLQYEQDGSGAINKIISIPKYNMANKFIIFWRWVDDFDVEIISRIYFHKDKIKDTMEKFVKLEKQYIDRSNFIPEYAKLQTEIYKCLSHQFEEGFDSRECSKKSNKLWSYSVYPALYDPKTKEVLTLCYNFPQRMFAELFKKDKSTVENAIITYMK